MIAIFQAWRIKTEAKSGRALLLTLGFAAVLLHASILHTWIDVAGQQNLSFFNVLSLVAWLNAVLILLVAIKKPTENLLVIAAPIAALSILLVLLLPAEYMLNTRANPKQLAHILLSIFTFSVLCIAALQALLLALQEHLLRKKQLGGISRVLPPVQAMETLLFQLVVLGFILLSIVLLSSFLSFDNLFVPGLAQKTISSIFAWLVFAILLLGRYLFGWRGTLATNYTLIGVFLLMFSYFGSKILVEVLL